MPNMPRIEESETMFLLNPSSGKKNVEKIRKIICKTVPLATCVITRKADDITHLMEDHLNQIKVYVLVGGDGTVSSAIPFFILHPEKTLAVYPNGSGNGFARETGFTKNIKLLMASIKNGYYIKSDVLKINDFYCINIAGLGIDSDVAHAFSKTKKRGFFKYIHLAINSFLHFKPIKLKMAVNNKLLEGEYMMCTVANTRQFGYNAYIVPMAKPNDGYFDIVLFKNAPFRKYFILAPQMFLGKLNDSKYLTYIRTSERVTIQSEFDKVNIDGEPQIIKGDINISILKEAIKVTRMPNCKW